MNKELIKLIVPEEILRHFEFTGYEAISGVYRIYLDEKQGDDHLPKELSKKSNVVSDGYLNAIELQTFPMNAKEVFLYLRRRKWKESGSKRSYSNSYNFHLKGMKATKEFGAFLKEIGRG
ncbi:MAG: hypothetical protein ABFS32_21935 [Bacteroidota bacterium]